MARAARTGKSNAALPLYLGLVAVVLAGVVALAAYPVELGIARPGTSARRVAVAVAEIDATLDDPSGHAEFSASLRAALAAHRTLAVRNPADNSVGHEAAAALDCYSALREAWQIELEGAWNPSVHGDPAYWRSFHEAVTLAGDGPLEPAEVREALRAEASGYVAEAMALVER